MQRDVEIFIRQPGEVAEMHCRVCGALCEVRRDVMGPTSFGASMARIKKAHDVFQCPNAAQDWHGQATELLQAMEDSPSKRLVELMRLDLQDLLRDHGPG